MGNTAGYRYLGGINYLNYPNRLHPKDLPRHRWPEDRRMSLRRSFGTFENRASWKERRGRKNRLKVRPRRETPWLVVWKTNGASDDTNSCDSAILRPCSIGREGDRSSRRRNGMWLLRQFQVKNGGWGLRQTSESICVWGYGALDGIHLATNLPFYCVAVVWNPSDCDVPY